MWKKTGIKRFKKTNSLKKDHSKEIEVAVDNIRKKFGALNKFAKLCSETNRVIYRLCNTKEKIFDESKYSRKLASEDREEIKQHDVSKEAVNYLPTAH